MLLEHFNETRINSKPKTNTTNDAKLKAAVPLAGFKGACVQGEGGKGKGGKRGGEGRKG